MRNTETGMFQPKAVLSMIEALLDVAWTAASNLQVINLQLILMHWNDNNKFSDTIILKCIKITI